MKIDLAYSLELCDIIDADTAHKNFWRGILSDQSLFVCSTSFCEARITCVNMEKLRNEMKRIPHFTSVTGHHEDCHNNTRRLKNRPQKLGGKDPYINEKIIRLMMKRPSSHFTKSKSVAPLQEKKSAVERFLSTLSKDNGISRRYSITPLINAYNHCKNGDNVIDKVIIGPTSHSLNQLFHPIETGFELETIQRIYFGKAWLEKTTTGILIKFLNKCDIKNNQVRPVVFISEKIIQSSFGAIYWNKKIQDILSQSKPIVKVYILSTPTIEVNQQGRTVIKLPIYNMDYIELE